MRASGQQVAVGEGGVGAARWPPRGDRLATCDVASVDRLLGHHATTCRMRNAGAAGGGSPAPLVLLAALEQRHREPVLAPLLAALEVGAGAGPRPTMEFLVDAATDRRLERLATKLELPRSAVIRMALRQ